MWQSRRVEFRYAGHSTFYRCTELATRVFSILEALGARSLKNVDARCDDFDQHQVLRFDVAVPVEATPANVQAATTYDAKQRLLAQVQGRSLPSATDIARFPAEWKKVSLMALRGPSFQMSDCELLMAVRTQILPLLSVRTTATKMRCASETATRIRPKFTVEALVASNLESLRDDRPAG